jgi:hypothetical protein
MGAKGTRRSTTAPPIGCLPFPIRKLESNIGSEFPLAFAFVVKGYGIKYRYIKPRPEQNGKVDGVYLRARRQQTRITLSRTGWRRVSK